MRMSDSPIAATSPTSISLPPADPSGSTIASPPPSSFAKPSSAPAMKLALPTPPAQSPPASSSRVETPRASMCSTTSKAPQAQEDPFASSFSASTPSSSTSSSAAAALRPPDYFQEKSRADSPMAMPAQPAERHEIPPTPGLSAVGRDHPWAKLLAGGNKGAAIPPTPGGTWTPGGLLGGGNLSLPTTRRAPAPVRQSCHGFSKPNGVGAQLKDPRPSSSSSNERSISNSTHNADEASEFASVPLTASLSLPVPAKRSGAGVSDDLSRFQGIECQTLASYLTDDGSLGDKTRTQPGVLVIDIRPSTSFAAGRVKSSINVCAPSTLLKRPGVTVQRIEDDMLQSEADRAQFCRWKSGPAKHPNTVSPSESSVEKQSAGVEKIIVLDTDTASIGAAGRPAVGGGGPCLVGLLKKFDTAGFAGELLWLVGGYHRFANYASEKPQLLERGAKNQTNEAPAGSRAEQANSAVLGAPQAALSSRLKLPGHQNAQSGEMSLPTGSPSLVQRGLPMEAFTNRTTTDEPSTKANSLPNARQATDNQRTGSVGNNTACNPFFDNIRQNRELQHGITERIPLEIDSLTVTQRESLPLFLRQMVDTDVPGRAERLAQGFFEVEKAEQNRLMATMRQHASESSVDPRTASSEQCNPSSPPSVSSVSSSPLNCSMQLSSPYCRVSSKTAPSLTSSAFPFSIAAAVERGAENRYNNIWTYEHSRVKVATNDADGSSHANGADTNSEYLNGSYVEPLREYGCYRSYIATQAPLPSTFETFWRAVWQQNSRTIAMLTREYESGRVQSHNYWSETSYGSTIKLRLVEEKELNSRGMPCNQEGASMSNASSADGGGFFADVPKASSKEDPVMILRKIELSYAGSNEPPRLVHHLQYIGWPDYTIPTDPEALLVFMDLASQCQHQAHLALSGGKTPKNDGMKWTRESATGPLMLHCSAGVGRTGTYAVVDSVLDVLRRERAKLTSVMPLGVWDNGVTVSGEARQPDDVVTSQDVEMIPINESLANEDGSSRSLPQTPERRIKNVKNAGLHPWPRAPSSAKKTEGTSAGVGADPSVRSTRGALRSSFSSNPTDSVDEAFSRSTRRSLKRELSPSAHMELDNAPSSQGGDAFGNNGSRALFDVPPPMRRNRSSSSDVALSTTSSSDTADSDFGVESSDSEAAKSRSGSLTSAAHPLPGWAHLGIRQPDGMDTPSRAMDGMSLGFNTSSPAPSAAASARESPCPVGSASTDNKGSTASLSSLGSGMTSGYSQDNSGRRGSVAKQARSSEAVSSPQQAAAAAAANASAANAERGAPRAIGRNSSPSPPQASPTFGDVDLVRRATDVAREQRMSSVQTQRQFVFCYSAVLKGILRETARGQGGQQQQN